MLGQNDVSSGSPIGFTGVVTNSSVPGFGIETPDSARIEGDLEATSGHALRVGTTPTLSLGLGRGNGVARACRRTGRRRFCFHPHHPAGLGGPTPHAERRRRRPSVIQHFWEGLRPKYERMGELVNPLAHGTGLVGSHRRGDRPARTSLFASHTVMISSRTNNTHYQSLLGAPKYRTSYR